MPRDDRTAAELLNLGRRSSEMLAEAGLHTVEQIRDLGPVVTFLAVKQAGQEPSMNLLWAITAGLQNRHWTDLSEQEKSQLRRQLQELTQ